MTVRELISELIKFDMDATVCIEFDTNQCFGDYTYQYADDVRAYEYNCEARNEVIITNCD